MDGATAPRTLSRSARPPLPRAAMTFGVKTRRRAPSEFWFFMPVFGRIVLHVFLRIVWGSAHARRLV